MLKIFNGLSEALPVLDRKSIVNFPKVLQVMPRDSFEYSAKKMTSEKFNAFLEAYKENIDTKVRDKIKSIFIGSSYGASSNEIINRYLREGILPQEHFYWNKSTLGERIKLINEIAEKCSLDESTTVYRGVKNLSFLPDKGEVFTEKGFMSTSISESVPNAYSGAGGALMEIILPSGTRCLPNGNDVELLLKSNSKFKVLEKGKTYAKLLLLPSEV